MIEFTMTRMTEDGREITEEGRASARDITGWNTVIRRAVEDGDQEQLIKVPTFDEGDWSDSYVRAILVKEITPKVTRPEGW